VLEQVSKTGPARSFVLRADVIPEVDGNERGGMVFVEDDTEAVGEAVVFEGEHRRRVVSQRRRVKGEE